MKTVLILITSILLSLPVSGQLKHAIRDEQGRHVIPRGFVINTEDSKGDIYYTPDDYHRMVKMGANFQVIRLRLGRLGGYPGNELEHLTCCTLIPWFRWERMQDMKTDFKMTVYGTTGFHGLTSGKMRMGSMTMLARHGSFCGSVIRMSRLYSAMTF